MRAYRPGRVICIFFAISECSGSMMTTWRRWGRRGEKREGQRE